jgi:thiol-disulfide isomerase/thioredoxin
MNGLLFLCSEDFYIGEVSNEKLLNTTIDQGLFLVFFYSTQCEHCQKAIPVFKQLPQMIQGCSFGMVNVSTNAKIVHMSRITVAPIQFVPLVVLYVNGEPYYRYKGAITLSEIQKFIVQMSKILETKQQFVKPPLTNRPGKRIPDYCAGVPYCDDDVCYLEFDEAYDKLKKQQNAIPSS